MKNEIPDKFDMDLMSALPEIPPGDIVKKVSPWSKAMSFIIAGFALTTITLNFLSLNYIMPSIGFILLFLGFRTLRNENDWVKYCWITSGIQLILNFIVLFVDGSIYGVILNETNWIIWRVIIQTLIQVFLLVFLAEGLMELQRKAGVKVNAGCIIAMMVWYVLAAFLGLSDAEFIITPILFVIIYILLLRSLNHIAGAVSAVGYTIKTSPVRFSDKWVGTISGAAALTIAVSACIFFSGYPMNWAPVDANQHSGVEDIKAHLVELGFPDDIIDDISAEDIEKCRNASEVKFSVYEYPGNYDIAENGGADDAEMLITDILVKIPGKRTKWRVFHFFCWENDPGFCGTEAIRVWTPERDESRFFTLTSEITGRVMYNMNGVKYSAPYYSITPMETIKKYSRDTYEVYADFSMPREGDSKRCYVTYESEQGSEQFLANGWAFYYHQINPLQYPARNVSDAADYGLTFDWDFKEIKTEVLFGSKDEAKTERESSQ